MAKIIVASGPVIVEDGKVLLNKSAADSFWKFCGGRVEDDEFNVINAAKREVKEEMGLDVEILDTNPYFVYTEKDTEYGKTSVILIHFLAKRLNEVSPGEETTEWEWISFNDLDKEELAPNIKPVLKHFGFIN